MQKLTLNRNPLGDDGLAALARSPYLRDLREFSVHLCGLTTRGLKHLARAPLGRLESLDISFNDGAGDAGLVAICDSPSLPSLHKLSHSCHGVRPRTLAALNARFGTGRSAGT